MVEAGRLSSILIRFLVARITSRAGPGTLTS
jgi:hypothetical protein